MNTVFSASTAIRKSNFELLRIVAMFMIVVSHYVVHGIMSFNTEYLNENVPVINKLLVIAIGQWGSISVTLFFMLTGFFLCRSENAKCFRVLFQTMFYACFLFLVFIVRKFVWGGLMNSGIISLFSLILLPLSSNQWWFVTSYVLLIFMTPYINHFVGTMKKKKFAYVVLFSICIWQTFGFILSNFKANAYYDIQRAICFYLLGVFANLHIERPTRKRIWLLVAVLIWGISAFARYIFLCIPSENRICFALFGMGRILIRAWIEPLIAFCIFMFFYSIDIGSIKIINIISACTFGVYLIHECPFVRSILWNGLFNAYDSYFSPFFVLDIFLVSVVIFTFCILFDFLRLKILEPKVLNFIKLTKDLKT